MPSYRQVDPELLHRSIVRLERRIGERFPLAGLRGIAREMVGVSERARATCRHVGRPIYLLRVPIWLLMLSLFGVIVAELMLLGKVGQIETILQFIEVLEPTLGTVFFLSAIVAFLLSLETRWKRARALDALHELRAMAHVIDLHQLTKDPTDPTMGEGRMPPDNRPLTPEELTRYLDFCSELLSHLSKLAVLYVQNFPDDVAVNAVDEIEALTNGLNRRIWQKIMILRQEHPVATTPIPVETMPSLA